MRTSPDLEGALYSTHLMRRFGLVCTLVLVGGEACLPERRPGDEPDVLSAEQLAAGDAEPGEVTQPAMLLVAVHDSAGKEVPNASIVVEGRGMRSDPEGNASFERLIPGVVTVMVAADGYAPQSRAIAVGPGALVRVVATLVPWSARRRYDPSEEIMLTSRGASVWVDADAWISPEGVVDSGTVQFDWAWTSDVQAVGRTAVDEDGAEAVLRPLGVVQVSASDGNGLTLRMDEGKAIEFSMSVPHSAMEDVADLVIWSRDPWTGTWLQRPEVAVSTTDHGAGAELTAALPGPGTYAIGASDESACLEIDLAPCEGLDALPLEVSVRGPGINERRAISTLDPTPTLEGLSPGAYELALYANGQALATRAVNLAGDDDCAVAELAFPTCVGLGVALQTEGQCPASSGRLRLRSDIDGAEIELDSDGLELLSDLPAGMWTVELLSSSGSVVASDVVELASGAAAALTLSGPGLSSLSPPGGCAPAPCSGDLCSSCLVLTVYGDGAPVPDAVVAASDPVDDVGTTDDAGEVCLDAPDGAGAEVLFATDGGWPGGAALQRGASCDEVETCSRRALWQDITPPNGWQVFELPNRVIDWGDPGLSVEAVDDLGWDIPTSVLTLNVTEGSLDLSGEDASSSLRCDGGVYATQNLDPDDVGLLWPGATLVRCGNADGVGVEVEIDWPAGPLAPGSLAVGEVQVRVGVSVGGTTRNWDATSGLVELRQRGEGRLDLAVQLDLAARGGMYRAAVDGVLSAPLLTAANTPRTPRGLREQDRPGVFTRVVALESGEEHIIGPGGISSPTFGPRDHTDPGIFPTDVSSQAFGLITGRDLSPTTPITIVVDDLIQLFGNVSDYPWALAPTALRGLSRRAAEDLYRANGRNVWEIDRAGTVIGRPARWEPGAAALVALDGFGTATLVTADGRTLSAIPISDDLGPTSADRATLFAFLGVPVASWDHPHVLTLQDRDGQEVPEYTMRLAPTPGSVTVLGWDADDD